MSASFALPNCLACLLFFSGFCTSKVQAQYEENDFIRYSVRDGLSHNYVNCLEQDNRGYLWIGTEVGLNRFDGNSFANFYQGVAPLPLASGLVSNLKKLRPYLLAILTRGGLQVLNTNNFSLQNYFIPDSTAFAHLRNAAWDAVLWPNGALALTTAAGFYVFNKMGNLIFRHDAYALRDVGRKRIRYGRTIIPISAYECLIFVEEDGLAYYNAHQNTYREITQTAAPSFCFYPVAPRKGRGLLHYCQLSQKELLFLNLSEKSFVYYNTETRKTVVSPIPLPIFEFRWDSNIASLNDSTIAVNSSYSGFYTFHLNRQQGAVTLNPKKYLPQSKVQCLYVDREGRLWIGTSKGLLQQKQKPPFLRAWSFEPATADSVNGGFSCAYRYKDNLYLGRFTQNKGLLIVDTATMRIKRAISIFGKNNPWNEIRSIAMYHPDTLWIGTNAGLVWLDTRTDHYGRLFDGKNNPAVAAYGLNLLTPANSKGDAWICSFLSGVVARYHVPSRTFTFFTKQTTPALPFDKVKSIVYDAYGDVWIGGHSLARWNHQRQVFDTLITVYGGANKFNDDILTLSADDKGSLWLHNFENGLLQYRIRQKSFVAYTMQDGLPSNSLENFSPVIGDNLWIGSANHLTCFNIRTKKTTVYDYTDGLPDASSKARTIYYDADAAKLYLLCEHWVVQFPPRPEPATVSNSKLAVEELQVNNTRSFYYPHNGMRLRPAENNVSLRFSVVDFDDNQYRFAYKLNNAENWTSLNQQRTVYLTNLPSGSYVVQLKVIGRSGDLKLQTFRFFITPPFWRKAPFLIAAAIAALGLAYAAYRSRIRQIHKRAELDKLLMQTEMKALHAQMNPHFISNSLNSIREMILNNENQHASHYITKFAHLIRITLEQSTQPFISLRNTMDYLQRYVDMEQIRNNHFTCSITADERLNRDETVLPPMLIQPFIENAIWHGISGNGNDIHITVHFAPEKGQLVCTVNDNGIGIRQSLQQKQDRGRLHRSVGISNIQNRIRLLNEKHNLKSAVSIQDKLTLAGSKETGTWVVLRLPLEITTP